MMKKTPKIKFRINPKATFRELNDKIYIFDPKKLELHSLNSTASFIWKKAKTSIDLEALIKLVCQEFGVQEHVAAEDVRSFVEYCLDKKIFRRINP